MSLRVDFCEWSGLGQLSLQSMKQLNWLTCYDGIDHDLRTFFKNSLYYYNWKKEQEGGINHFAALPEMPAIYDDSDSIDSPLSPAGSIIEEVSWQSSDDTDEAILGVEASVEPKDAAADSLPAHDCVNLDDEEDSVTSEASNTPPASAHPCASEHPTPKLPTSLSIKDGRPVEKSEPASLESLAAAASPEAPECITLDEEENNVIDEDDLNVLPASSPPHHFSADEPPTTALPISHSTTTGKRQLEEDSITSTGPNTPPTSTLPCANEHSTSEITTSHSVKKEIKMGNASLESPAAAASPGASECITLDEEGVAIDEAVPNLLPVSSPPRYFPIFEPLTTALSTSHSTKTGKRPHLENKNDQVISEDDVVFVDIDDDDEINCIWQAPTPKKRRLCSSSEALSNERQDAPSSPISNWPKSFARRVAAMEQEKEAKIEELSAVLE